MLTTVAFFSTVRAAASGRFASCRLRFVLSAGALAVLVFLPLVAGCSRGGTPVPAPLKAGGAANRGGNSAQYSHGIVFTNVADSAGIDYAYRNGAEAHQEAILQSLGGGVGALDYDGDGWTDLCFPGGGIFVDGPTPSGVPGALYRNRGSWQFQEVSADAGADDTRYYTHGCAGGDFNNDGFIDLLISGFGGLQLLVNQGDGTLVEQAESAGLVDTLWSTGTGWADFDGDGNLDVYVAHYVDWSPLDHHKCQAPIEGLDEICSPKEFQPLPHSMYYGNGDGTFRDVTREVGLRPDGKGLGVIVADVDGDNDVDIYVANDTTINFLYVNQLSETGSAVFSEEGELQGVFGDDTGNPTGSMGTDVGDYNGDLAPDLWCANFERDPFGLYRNERNGSFLHVSQTIGITVLGDLFVGFGTSFGDIDRDGDEDLFVACGHVILFPQNCALLQTPLLLLNQDKRTFDRAMFPPGCYFGDPHMGRGLATADFDRDGDLDIAISNTNEKAGLLDNRTPPRGGWFAARLIGRVSNRDAIGAQLVLHTSAGPQLQIVKGGGSYLSHSDRLAFWGVPEGAAIEKLSILWPSGQKQELTGLSAGENLVVIEPAP